MAAQNIKTVIYSKEHMDIVKSGIGEIRRVLFGSDSAETDSLLFCLDYFLDPYYKQDIPHKNDIFTLLEEFAVTSENEEQVNDALQLLNYCTRPLPVLENNIENIIEVEKEYAMYVLHPDT
ncbi:MAG: hypothetical protein J5997_00730 [Oscillospiraceae bacterium]|nr:hypothetical protein [Oscillospiraceae bacterium]